MMTSIRLLRDTDVLNIIDMIYEIYATPEYPKDTPLTVDAVSNLVYRSITKPEVAPCFVHDDVDDKLGGLFFGTVEYAFFSDELWFTERTFYIRPKLRSFRLACDYIHAVEQWCKQHKIKRIELGNGLTRDPRIDVLYKKFGYQQVNVLHAKRI